MITSISFALKSILFLGKLYFKLVCKRFLLTGSGVPEAYWSRQRTDFVLYHWVPRGSECWPPWSPGCGTTRLKRRQDMQIHHAPIWRGELMIGVSNTSWTLKCLFWTPCHVNREVNWRAGSVVRHPTKWALWLRLVVWVRSIHGLCKHVNSSGLPVVTKQQTYFKCYSFMFSFLRPVTQNTTLVTLSAVCTQCISPAELRV